MSDPVRDYQRAAQVRPLEGEIPANDDRLAQARAEAERRYPPRRGARLVYTAAQVDLYAAAAFVAGVEWADDDE